MNIQQIYNIQTAHNINVRNGNTQSESATADQWSVRFGYLAAFLGWDHTIDENADEDSSVFKTLRNNAPTTHEYHNLAATYEIAGLVASNGTAVKMEA